MSDIVISCHINNIFKDKEVDEESNMQKMHIANSDKSIKFHSLDMIMSVGYRVNLKKQCANFAHTTQHEITIYEFEKNSAIWNFRTAHKWMVATCSKLEQVVIQNVRVL